MAAKKPYRWLAEYYDQMFAFARAPLDAARKHVLADVMPHVESACDLACGTGTAAAAMARRGIEMYGVDLSPVMCRLARAKDLRVIRADMRNFRLPKPVDLITCEFDAINHVPRKSDLRAVTQAVARALRPGGWFYFDVNNARGFRRYWSGDGWFEQPGIVMVMRNGHDRACDRAWSDVTWFIRDGSRWRRYVERVEEVAWTEAEIRGHLRAAGFGSVRAWDATPFFKNDPMIVPGCRTVWLARKDSG